MRTFNCALIILILTFSCTSIEEEREKNQYEIISILIEHFGKSDFPPPPPGRSYTFSKIQLDSIRSQKQNIALYPVLKDSNDNFLKSDSDDFNILTQNLKNLKEKIFIDISKINLKTAHNISILDTLKLASDRNSVYNDFNKIISFSQISFNQEYTKAVLVVGVSKGYLNGYASLVFLEKIDNIWQIKGTDTFSIS
ncbi:hypothetical protein [Aquimarina algiphila]|uniref:hypothetical protein n=1 Tax=Aquimarina algiphila TaxID=2047982 RepID=UPI00249321E0|nr:hypothetical protein [Aquimarina algiphila]